MIVAELNMTQYLNFNLDSKSLVFISVDDKYINFGLKYMLSN